MNMQSDKASDNKPVQIRQLREKISMMKDEIAALEKSFGESSDFSKFLIAKTAIAENAITEAIRAEEDETDRQTEKIRQEHKEKLAEIDKEIEAEKDKARRILTGIEAEIAGKAIPVPAPVPEPVPVFTPAPAPAVSPVVEPVPVPSAFPVPEAAVVSEQPDMIRTAGVNAADRNEKSDSTDGATDDEIEMLVRELKERKFRKMNLEAAANEVLREEEVMPVSSNEISTGSVIEEKVIEGFWEDDEEPVMPAPEQEEPQPQSKGSTGDFETKHAFILGKFAGDNLFDGSGKLIIAKDEIITDEVIAKAESEGKLVDLIVDMKFS